MRSMLMACQSDSPPEEAVVPDPPMPHLMQEEDTLSLAASATHFHLAGRGTVPTTASRTRPPPPPNAAGQQCPQRHTQAQTRDSRASTPLPSRPCRAHDPGRPPTRARALALDHEFSVLLAIEAVDPLSCHPRGFYSTYFLVTKKTGGERPILRP